MKNAPDLAIRGIFFMHQHKPVGDWLADDSDFTDAIAGKPAPTGDLWLACRFWQAIKNAPNREIGGVFVSGAKVTSL